MTYPFNSLTLHNMFNDSGVAYWKKGWSVNHFLIGEWREMKKLAVLYGMQSQQHRDIQNKRGRNSPKSSFNFTSDNLEAWVTNSLKNVSQVILLGIL